MQNGIEECLPPKIIPHTSRRYVLAHGICNEILEEFAKKKEMCHLEGKKKRTFPVIRRHYE